LDSRKRYVILPVLFLVIGWVLRYLPWLRRAIQFATSRAARLGPVLAVAMMVAAFPTTCMYVNLWRYDCHRMAKLVDYCIRNEIRGPVRIEWVPDIYQAWPGAVIDWPYRLDGVWPLGQAFATDGPPRLQLRDDATLVLQYDPAADDWRSLSEAPGRAALDAGRGSP
jgi:hypothetical protein